ncbi:MAG TPA: tRNA preQ1(34) S-adenosylmethionine ribosyltransferase-isomerase QueA [Minicystis sp.]|nr:tRNA preQ1(34) S-adenosylmethionine ribosyltransferase-isomerase QueA [Minicystis sp.]
MRRDLLRYELPDELVARHPPAERDGGRLLGVDPSRGAFEHAAVRDLDRFVAPGTVVVVNDTRVVPARLYGKKAGTGGAVELLLLGRASADADRFRAMARASKPLRPGARVEIEGGELVAEIASERAADGLLEVRLAAKGGASVDEAIERAGHVPLPPYLGRGDEPADRARYQTVYARVPGAVAAPTAGLHLSNELIARLEARGVAIASITLHVGLGTFQPVTAEDLDAHPMHAETFDVPLATAQAIARARREGAPVLAVGTTVVRALESAADPERAGEVRATGGETRLLIQPGYRFRVVDRLLTNFHLPESTLLALVAAFAGRELVLDAYAAAVAARYRFFSYGDAMLIAARAEPAA